MQKIDIITGGKVNNIPNNGETLGAERLCIFFTLGLSFASELKDGKFAK